MHAALFVHDHDVCGHRGAGPPFVVACRRHRCNAHIAADEPDIGAGFQPGTVRLCRATTLALSPGDRGGRCAAVHGLHRSRVAA